MNKLENKEKIKTITMHPTACIKCRIGQDWYRANFAVAFQPGAYYPDYMEVEKFVMDNIDGWELNIEEAVERLFDHLKGYEPADLAVTCAVKGSKVHFDVEVGKW